MANKIVINDNLSYWKANVSFVIHTHTTTDIESLVKINAVVAEIFSEICQFLPVFFAQLFQIPQLPY